MKQKKNKLKKYVKRYFNDRIEFRRGDILLVILIIGIFPFFHFMRFNFSFREILIYYIIFASTIFFVFVILNPFKQNGIIKIKHTRTYETKKDEPETSS